MNENWNIQIISSHYTIVVTYIHMYMAIVVHECGTGANFGPGPAV